MEDRAPDWARRISRQSLMSHDHPAWADGWVALWTERPHHKELRKIARRFLRRAPPGHAGWPVVWRVLMQRPAEDLVALGEAWLAANPNDPAWGRVWKKLRRSVPGTEALDAQGTAWLSRGALSSETWGTVWITVWQACGPDAGRATVARRWLAEQPERPEWHVVWTELLAFGEDAELWGLAERWLRRALPSHPSWGTVWCRLAARDPAWHPEGLAWLRDETLDRTSWSYVWKQLWLAGVAREELEALARDRLARDGVECLGWPHVWLVLWQEREDEALAALARRWVLEMRQPLGIAGVVWRAIRERFPGDAALVDRGRRWLKGTDFATGAWARVWRPVWDAEPGPELAALGEAWLAWAAADHPDRALVADALAGARGEAA